MSNNKLKRGEELNEYFNYFFTVISICLGLSVGISAIMLMIVCVQMIIDKIDKWGDK